MGGLRWGPWAARAKRVWGVWGGVPPGPPPNARLCQVPSGTAPRQLAAGCWLTGHRLILVGLVGLAGREVLVALAGELLDRQRILLAQLLPGQLLQPVPRHVVRVGQADRPIG